MADISALYPVWCIPVIIVLFVLYFLAFLFRLLVGGSSADEGERVKALNRLIEHDQETDSKLHGMTTEEFNLPEVKKYRASRRAQAAALLQDLNNKGGHTSR